MTITPDFLAEEDMAILSAIARALTARLGKFRINLPGGASLTNTNSGEPDFPFVGIDTIKMTLDQVMSDAGDATFCIVMPTNRFEKRYEIGRLFDIPVFVDPSMPKDKFLIQEMEKSK